MQFSFYRSTNDNFEVDGENYEVDASFDNILRTIELYNSTDYRADTQILVLTMMLFGDESYEKLVNNYNYLELKTICDSALETYIKEKKRVEYDDLGNEVPQFQSDENVKMIDFDTDANEIYSSFMQTYGIDLHEELGKMHWFKFIALLNGLPDNTRIREIMSYRGYEKPPKGQTHHDFMMKMKNKYTLESEVVDDVE